MYLLHLKQANNNSPSKRPHQRLPERARRWQGQEFESAFVTLETSEQVICHQAKSPTNVSPKGRDIGRAKIDLICKIIFPCIRYTWNKRTNNTPPSKRPHQRRLRRANGGRAKCLMTARRYARLKRTNLPVIRLSLNRSQWGGCSTKYDTPTET